MFQTSSYTIVGPSCLLYLFTCYLIPDFHVSLDVPISRPVLHNTFRVGPVSPGMGSGLFFPKLISFPFGCFIDAISGATLAQNCDHFLGPKSGPHRVST